MQMEGKSTLASWAKRAVMLASFALMLCLALSFGSTAKASWPTNVTSAEQTAMNAIINAQDASVRAAMAAGITTDGTGGTGEHIIGVDWSGIDLTGMINFRSFPQLETIDVSGLSTNPNELTGINVLNLSNLTGLNVAFNNLTSLSLTGCTDLESLDCQGNALTGLSVASLNELTALNCSLNALTSLNLSGATKIETLNCEANALTALSVSALTDLEVLDCSHNELSALDVGACAKLEELDCSNNITLQTLAVENLAFLTTLDAGYCIDSNYLVSGKKLNEVTLSELPLLTDLTLRGNRLDKLTLNELDVLTDDLFDKQQFTYYPNAAGELSLSALPAFEAVDLSGLNIAKLTVADMDLLRYINADDNRLTTLNLSASFPALEHVSASNNQLTSLLLGNNQLIHLTCMNNRLTTLNLSASKTTLYGLVCASNKLTALPVGADFTELTVLDCGDNLIQDLTLPVLNKLTHFSYDGGSAGNNNRSLTIGGLNALKRISVTGAVIQSVAIRDLPNLEGTAGDYNADVNPGAPCINLSASKLGSLELNNLPTIDNDANPPQPPNPDPNNNNRIRALSSSIDSLTIKGLPALITLDAGIFDNGGGVSINALRIDGAMTSLKAIDLASGSLRTLSISGADNLTRLDCSKNYLTALSLGDSYKLEQLNCMNNQLTSLDVSLYFYLTQLICDDNALTSLILNDENHRYVDQYALESVQCSGNELQSLRAVNLSNLKALDSSDNKLTSLVMVNLPRLSALMCGGNDLKSLALADMVKLENMDCTGNPLESASLKNLPLLRVVSVASGSLKTLELNGLPKVGNIVVSSNQLTQLSVTAMPALSVLDASNNKLTSVQLGGLTGLKHIMLSDNALTSLSLSSMPKLEGLSCKNNALTSLKLTGLDALLELDAGNNKLTELALSGTGSLQKIVLNNNALTSFDASGLKSLVNLQLAHNALTSLALSSGNIRTLNVQHNRLTALNVSGARYLNELNCANNALSALNLSGLYSLQRLECQNNQLGALTLAGKNWLTYLNCSYNKLTSLDLTAEKALVFLDCSHNLLGSIAANACEYLDELYVNDNNLKALALPRSVDMRIINCSNNPLESLDISVVPNLTELYCLKTELRALDLSSNRKLTKLEYDLIVDVQKLTMERKLTLAAGAAYDMKVAITPANATDQRLIYSCSNPGVATIDENGRLKAIKAGTATVRATTFDGKFSVACSLTVTMNQRISSVATQANLTLTAGKGATIPYEVYPAALKDRRVTFASTNVKVATVSAGGYVRAIAPGRTNITVKSFDGTKSARCTVKVVALDVPLTSIRMSRTGTVPLERTKSLQLKAVLNPIGATGCVVKWASSNKRIATVDRVGKVTPLRIGLVSITATAGGKTVKLRVKVGTKAATGLRFNKTKLTLISGQSFTIAATRTPYNTSPSPLTWQSSNWGVAKIVKGKITARKAGTAVITATTWNGKKATCIVTVKPVPTPTPAVTATPTATR